ncbi:MAG: MBL fold metallo-hydrolase [Muribaculaceae bacterium]|nr:MBL fold metallo-hydrolase [Muribaculaceae bacterium]
MKVTIFQLSLFGINTYVVSDPNTNDCAVIDPGMITPEEEQAVTHFIESNKLHLTHIINTHLHIDHAAGISYLRRLYGAPVYAHPDDAVLGQRISDQALMFGIPQKVENISDTRQLRDGDIIHIGEGILQVIHVPGHSPGSVALYDPADGFLIAGDILFAGSIGRTDLPGGSHQQLISGIKSKLMTLPPDTIVYPGHGPATTIGHELRNNPFL